MTDFLLPLAAYLLGSISTAILTCKIMQLPDPRSYGSKNPGATNVLRLGGKKAAGITLIGDLLKGLLPTLGAGLLSNSSLIIALTAIAAFLGHVFPAYYQFKGGKGVATAMGAVFGLSWIAGILLAITWLLISRLFKISSLAALTAFFLTPLYLWISTHNMNYTIALVLISVVLAVRHRSNIQRILEGSEPKIGDKKEIIH